MTWLWLAVAGALGALARFALAQVLLALGAATPWGAFAANVFGCAAYGVIVEVAGLSPQVKVVLAVGFLGAFTTFSAYVADIVSLAQAGRLGTACAWVIAHNVVGLLAFLVGASFGRAIT